MTPAASAAANARSASARLSDIGFSQKIAFPAAAAATIRSACLRRSSDDDCRDLRVIDQLDRTGEGARAVAIGQCLRGLGSGVDDRGETCAWYPLRDDAGVRGADRPAPISPIAIGSAVSTAMMIILRRCGNQSALVASAL